MRKLFKSIVVMAIIGVMILGAVTPAFAYNGIPTNGNPPVLSANNVSLNGATWTPWATKDPSAFQIHPGDKMYPTQRLYPKPAGATLPAMGWNSWNAFFSSISPTIITGIADAVVSRGLNKCGYKYVVTDDGTYDRSANPLAPSTSTSYGAPSFAAYTFEGYTGFRALSEYVHSKGLKFGMYNDSGTSTCAGQPGAYPTGAGGGREDTWAQLFVNWGIDSLKFDFCNNGWDGSAAARAGCYIQKLAVTSTGDNPAFSRTVDWSASAPAGVTYVSPAARSSSGYISGLGVSSNTSYRNQSVNSGAAYVTISGVPAYGVYDLGITRMNGGSGRYLMVDVNGTRVYDGLTSSVTAFPATPNTNLTVTLKAGTNVIALYNSKFEDCGLYCYANIRDAFQKANTVVPGHAGQDVSLKICEWGNCASPRWANMVGESNRLYSDIFGNWSPNMGTWGWVHDQYLRVLYLNNNGYANLGGCWPDGDMMVIALGTSRADSTAWSLEQNRQHFDTYCAINSALILGFDLRSDSLWNRINDTVNGHHIIDNRNVIMLSQDPYGISGRKVKVGTSTANLTAWSTSNSLDYIAKPLSGGDVGVCFTNWTTSAAPSLTINEIVNGLGDLILNRANFTASAESPIYVMNLDSGAVLNSITSNTANIYQGANLAQNTAVTYRLSKTPFKAGLNANSSYGVGISFDQLDFVGGKLQVGTSDGTPGGTPVYKQNQATGLATVNNNTGADIKAAIKLDLYKADGSLEWSKTGDIKTIQSGWLVPWEFKVDLPDFVTGKKLTATLVDEAGNTVIDADTNAPVLSYTRYADPVVADSVKLSFAGVNSNSVLNAAADTALVGTNPIIATGTLFNNTAVDKKAVIVFGIYKNDKLISSKFSEPVVIKPEQQAIFSDQCLLPADVSGVTVKAFLWDPDTFIPYAPNDVK